MTTLFEILKTINSQTFETDMSGTQNLSQQYNRDTYFREILSELFKRNRKRLAKELKLSDANGFSIAFILKLLGWSESSKFLMQHKLEFYNEQDNTVAEKLGFQKMQARPNFPHTDIFHLAKIIFPEQPAVTMFGAIKPSTVLVQETGAKVKTIPISEFERLVGISNFGLAIKLPHGIDSFLPILVERSTSFSDSSTSVLSDGTTASTASTSALPTENPTITTLPSSTLTDEYDKYLQNFMVALRRRDQKPVISSTMLKESAESLSQKLVFEYVPGPMGWIVKVSENVTRETMLMPYVGTMASEADTKQGDYILTHHEYSECCISATDYRHAASFIPHMPPPEGLADLSIDPFCRDKIATASCKSKNYQVDGIVITILSNVRSLVSGEILGVDYGPEYFKLLKMAPRFFDKELQQLIPLPLCHQNKITIQFNAPSVEATLSLKDLWRKIKCREPLVLRDPTGQLYTISIIDLRAKLIEMQAFPKVSENINNADFDSPQALIEAIKKGDFDTIWYLIDFHCVKLNINEILDSQGTALNHAVLHYKPEILMFLLARGAELKDNDKIAVLKFIAEACKNAEGNVDKVKSNEIFKLFTRTSSPQNQVATSPANAAAAMGTFSQQSLSGRPPAQPSGQLSTSDLTRFSRG